MTVELRHYLQYELKRGSEATERKHQTDMCREWEQLLRGELTYVGARDLKKMKREGPAAQNLEFST